MTVHYRMGGMGSEDGRLGSVVRDGATDALSREVYCILGMPIDVIDMPTVLRRIQLAAANSSLLFLSTPNLNFLANGQLDPEFRESLLLSDLCPADGMAIVWLGRLLGVPIKDRVAGSDIFAALKTRGRAGNPLKVFLFGGDDGVAAKAARELNVEKGGILCVGWFYPGFCSVEELSQDYIIDMINSSGADFLVVCLGSKKGQLWLKRNSGRLQIPIRSHLGASLNFEAGTVKRAPVTMRKMGLEWLWRIKEEPYLWKRYWHDGTILVRLLLTQVLPLAIHRVVMKASSEAEFGIDSQFHDDGLVRIKICGAATQQNINKLVPTFRAAVAARRRVVLDFSGTCAVDARFLGLLLVFRRIVKANNADLILTGFSPELKKYLHRSGVEFLLTTKGGAEIGAVVAPRLLASS